MNKFLVFFILSMVHPLFSGSIKIIPYDWVGQFGLFKQNGRVLFNTDWKSKKLLFDGVLSNYPTMYGADIENNFQEQLKPNFIQKSIDSSIFLSKINYKQGDFSLDQFSFHLDSKQKNRSYNLIGFKRSYLGNQNQYFHNSLQPIQQSYVGTFSSKKDNNLGSISIGHFNTYSGFPDIVDQSYLSNRITNANTHFQHSKGKLNFIFSLDNFLQRYKSNHSLALTSDSRYLTRNTLQGKVESSVNHNIEYSLGFILNKRSLQLDSILNQNWNNYYLSAGFGGIGIYFDLASIGDSHVYNFVADIEKSTKNFDFIFCLKEENKPIHPYYYFKNSDIRLKLIEKNRFNSFTAKWRSKQNTLLSRISSVKEINPNWINKAETQTIYLEYINTMLPTFEFGLFYNKEKYITYQTGGLGDWIALDLKSNFKTFSGYMDITLKVNVKHFSETLSNVYFNPIEFVPIFSTDNIKTQEMNILNGTIGIKVSSFVIQYSWINMLELFNYYKEGTEVQFNPKMPLNGSQKSLTIKWHFKD